MSWCNFINLNTAQDKKSDRTADYILLLQILATAFLFKAHRQELLIGKKN